MPREQVLIMDLFLMILALGLLVGILSFVLYNHWQEIHGDNHY